MAYDFPNTPTLGQTYQGYVWDGEKWLSAGGTPPIGNVKKNYIINGAMMVSQENGATAGTVAGYYIVDQFLQSFSNAGTQTAQQIASPTPGGSPNRIRVTATVADASVAATDVLHLQHKLEGLRTADLRLGTSSAKTVTLQFGVKAPAGTYTVTFYNGAGTRTYTAEYVISAGEANTDVVKSVTVALDKTGTWASDNTLSLLIAWNLMSGTNYQGVPNTWGGVFFGTANQLNFMGTAGNVFELFDVTMVEGTVAPPYVVPDYPGELALCQRYWASALYSFNGYMNTYYSHYIYFPQSMRATPTIVITNSAASVAAPTGNPQNTTSLGSEVYHTVAAPGIGYVVDTWKANARI